MTAAPRRVVVVGAGQTAQQLAASLRDEGYDGAITLLGDEPHAPYSRPPLSKTFLKGETEEEDLRFRTREWFADQRIDLRLGARVAAIDASSRSISGAWGALNYDALVLASGTRARRLPTLDPALSNVVQLRAIEDALRLKTLTGEAQSVAILGGGFIGLEYAAVARQSGKRVTVVEAAPRLMARSVSPFVSEWFASLHRSNGVDLRLGVLAQNFEIKDGAVASVKLNDGARIDCDLLLVGVGAAANDEIARAAGVEVDDGVLIGPDLATSIPDIYAIGDCARFYAPALGRSLRLESVQNAVDQAKALARALASGEPASYAAVPWFWTEQFDIKLQIAGIAAEGAEERIDGDPIERSFSVSYLENGAPTSVFSFNDARSHITARKQVRPISIGPRPNAAAEADRRPTGGARMNVLLKVWLPIMGAIGLALATYLAAD